MTNPVSNHDMKVFSGLSNPDLSKRIAKYCGVKVSQADFELYTNGESDVDIQDSVRGKNVYIVQSSGRDTNNHLMGLLLFIQVCLITIFLSFCAQCWTHPRVMHISGWGAFNHLIKVYIGLQTCWC